MIRTSSFVLAMVLIGVVVAQPKVPTPAASKVVETKVIPDTLDLGRWKLTGPVEFTVSEKDAPGTESKALRAEVSLTHEARKKRSYTAQTINLPEAQDWSGWNRLVLWVFVEPSRTMRGGGVSAHLYNADDKIRRTTGPYILPRGRWQEVVWDITPMPRKGINRIMITQGVHRHNPGEADRIVYHFGRMELRHVDPPTKVHGWEMQPHRVAFSHVGYTPSSRKTAIFDDSVGDTVRLLDAATGDAVWQGKLKPVSHPRTGEFKMADFSEVRKEGRYVLVADGPKGPVPTEAFAIQANVFEETIRRVVDFYRAERCGDAAPGYHTPCHLDDGWVKPYKGMKPEKFPPEVRALFGKHIDCSGGWHDAGDQAKFAYQEYNSAAQLLRLFERGMRYARPGEQRDAVLDEGVWGAKYALKTLLPTGRNCDRPESVKEGVWTDNIPGNADDRIVGIVTWSTPERKIAGMMAEAIAARLVKDGDPKLAEQCVKQARLEAEAYLTGAMKDWRDGNWMPLRYSSIGLAFLELYRTTGEKRYAEEAVRCGDELAGLQEQGLAWNDKGITGFWYGSSKRKYPFAHSAGDGRSAYLLAELCREFPDHPSWMKWYAALRIYARFYAQATSKYLAPYGVPAFSLHGGPDAPYNYWDHARVFGKKGSQKLDFQFDRLVKVGHLYLVRIRNCNSALNASAMTLAAVADVAHDPEAEAIAQRCMQWMVGRNPFSRSQVWDVGYRFREQPHYVATHDEMPGSLPCRGISGRLDGDGVYHDEPYSDPLPRCVINEVCIAQSQYLITAGRELAVPATLCGTVHGTPRPTEVVARYADTDDVAARSPVDDKGEYCLVLPGGGWYDIAWGPVKRREFIASATDRRDFDIDLAREVSVAVECPDEVKPGESFGVRVQVASLVGKQAEGRHEIRLRLHNLTCDAPTQTVALTGKQEGSVTFRVVPQRPSEPFLVLAVPDGQLPKRGERMGVVGAE